MGTEPKPIDRWLGLASLAAAFALFLLAKTPGIVVSLLVLIFAVLVHPVWNFWWIEKSLFRRVGALAVLTALLVFLGRIAWPTKPTPSPPSPMIPTPSNTVTITTSPTRPRLTPTETRTESPNPTLVPQPTPVSSVTYDYQGIKRITRGGVSHTESGAEVKVYWRMWDLSKGGGVCRWLALRDFAEAEMRRTPEWITPQVYLGFAYLALGEIETGDRLIHSAQARVGNNPDYAGLLALIEPTPTDRLSQQIRVAEVPRDPYGAPTPTPCPAY